MRPDHDDLYRRGGHDGRYAMSATPDPVHLSSHHRTTLQKILQHPAGHNIEWHDALSLLRAVGSVVEHHDGKVAVTVGADTRVLDVPAHKDIDVRTVVDLRRMLSAAGYGVEA
jgi:hypothetical protein